MVIPHVRDGILLFCINTWMQRIKGRRGFDEKMIWNIPRNEFILGKKRALACFRLLESPDENEDFSVVIRDADEFVDGQ